MQQKNVLQTPRLWRLLFVLLAPLPLPAHAGAWLQPEGRGYVAAQFGTLRSDAFFDDVGEKQDQQRFDKYEINLYSEYGLTPWLTVGSNLFLNRASQGDDSNIGLADSELFARMKLAEYEGYVLSIQPLIKLPSLHEDRDPPRAGSRSFDEELSLLLGGKYPIISERDYIDMRVGYRNRSRHLNGQYRIDVAYGIYLSEQLAVIPAYRSVIAQQIDDNATFREDGEQDFDLHKLELGLAWQYAPDQYALFSVYSHVAGSFTGAGEGFTLGLGWQF